MIKPMECAKLGIGYACLKINIVQNPFKSWSTDTIPDGTVTSDEISVLNRR